MNTNDLNVFVHATTDGRFVVAEKRDGRFYGQSRHEAGTVFGSLDYITGIAWTYKTKRAALKKAASIYSY